MPRDQDYLPETPSQTAGPYVHIGLSPGAAGIDAYEIELGATIAGTDVPGERVRIEGLIFDGTGSPIKDALLEVWQADANGHYPGRQDATTSGFRGWGRAITDFSTGLWQFETIKPGAVPTANGALQAPHINVWVVARGINTGLHTRIYFSDEEQANATDPLLNLIEWEARRTTLIARRQIKDDGPVYRFDIRLQGPDETVFLDV